MIRVPAFRLAVLCLVLNAAIQLWAQDLHLTQRDVLETHGLSVLLFHNSYHRVFGDQKMSGLEIILQDQRLRPMEMFACRPLLRSGIRFLSSKAESARAAGMKLWHAANTPIKACRTASISGLKPAASG